MILWMSVSLSLSFVIAFSLVDLLCQQHLRTTSGLGLRCGLALGFGCGLSSLLFFWWLCLTDGRQNFIWTFEVPELLAAISLFLAATILRTRYIVLPATKAAQLPNEEITLTRILRIVLCITILLASSSFIMISLTNPHGSWDAWSIWNMRARFLARGTANWHDAFAGNEGLPHTDYPLLLSGTIARCWKWIGSEVTTVPIIIAALFTVGTLCCLVFSLVILRGKKVAYLAGTVLIGTATFVEPGATQYADSVVAFFILASIATLCLHDAAPVDSQHRQLSVLAGLAAGCCAWTKNEGLLFALVFIFVRIAALTVYHGARQAAREATALLSVALPFLGSVAYLKIYLAPHSFLVAGTYAANGPMKYFLGHQSLGERLTSLSRYAFVGKAMILGLVTFCPKTVAAIGVLYVISFVLDKSGRAVLARNVLGQNGASVGVGIIVLSIMLVGFFCIYVITPLNLEHHVSTSLPRLLLQLWPGSVFLLFVATTSKNV